MKNLINTNVTLGRVIKTLIFTIAISRRMNQPKTGIIQPPNNNLFEISATNDFGNGSNFKNLICYDNGTEGTPIFSFDNEGQSVKVLNNWYNGPSRMVTNLNTLNTDINLTPAQIEQKTISQLIITTWDTLVGVDPANPLNEQGIRSFVLDNIVNDRLLEDTYKSYQKLVEYAQRYFPL